MSKSESLRDVLKRCVGHAGGLAAIDANRPLIDALEELVQLNDAYFGMDDQGRTKKQLKRRMCEALTRVRGLMSD